MAFPITAPPSTGKYSTAQGILDALINGTAKVVIDGVELDGDVIVEAPGINTKYDVFSSTITNGQSDINIPFVNVTTAYNILILNKTTGTTLKVKLDGTGNTALLANNDNDEFGKALSGQNFDSIHLTNDSGSTITYEITISGV